MGPGGVVGGARPAHHPVAHGEGDQGDEEHSHRLAPDVGGGGGGGPAPLVGGGVPQLQGREGVAGLVERGREDEDHEPGEALDQQLGIHARLRYLFSRVSMMAFVPTSMNGGTMTVRPVSILAGLYEALAVAPFMLGSVSTISRVTVFGSSMPTARS